MIESRDPIFQRSIRDAVIIKVVTCSSLVYFVQQNRYKFSVLTPRLSSLHPTRPKSSLSLSAHAQIPLLPLRICFASELRDRSDRTGTGRASRRRRGARGRSKPSECLQHADCQSDFNGDNLEHLHVPRPAYICVVKSGNANPKMHRKTEFAARTDAA